MQQLRSDISNIARADADIVTKSCDGRHKIVRRSSQDRATVVTRSCDGRHKISFYVFEKNSVLRYETYLLFRYLIVPLPISSWGEGQNITSETNLYIKL